MHEQPTIDHPGPFFDDLSVGQTLDPAPAVTIDSGMAAVYQAICGDPLALPLSRPLAETVTGQTGALVNPALVLQVSIGQSTVATRTVIANLFYRGVALHRPVRHGETLHSTVTIRGLRELSRRDDRPARGLALLGIHTNCVDNGATVADYQRCAMLRFRDPDTTTGHDDDLGEVDHDVDLAVWAKLVPENWNLDPLRAAARVADRTAHPISSSTMVDPMRDTVTNAPELARLTQNLAPVHRDPSLGPGARRLVYGGHTIGLAQASVVRLLPDTATLLGWQSCDHPAPVFEDDVLSFRHTLLDEQPVPEGRLRAFRTEVEAERTNGSTETVLDWRHITLST